MNDGTFGPNFKDSLHSCALSMVNVVVILRPSEDQPASAIGRGAVYRAMLEDAEKSRDRLIAWLKERSLWKEVQQIGVPNAFNMLPLTCTKHVAALLPQAPDVEAVAPADTPIGLID